MSKVFAKRAFLFRLPHPASNLSRYAPHNKSLDASGGGVFRIMTGAAMLEWNRAAANSAVRRYLGKTMGLQTDLFVGSIDDARNYDGEATTALERDQPGGLTNLEFETLWAIVANEAWDVKRHALEEVASTEESDRKSV